MCLHNVSGTVRVIKMTSANRLTASGCIASGWVYRSIVNLLETPDGKFRDDMHTLSLLISGHGIPGTQTSPVSEMLKGIAIASTRSPATVL